MKTIILLLCIFFVSCTVNRRLPQPSTIIKTPTGTFVTFTTKKGGWLIVDTVGNCINVIPVNLYRKY